jgi:outer membrane autotransporter protein
MEAANNLRRYDAALKLDPLDLTAEAACTEAISRRCLFRRWRASAKPPRAQWRPRALRAILLIAPLALAAARGADAQTFIGPGTITSTQTVTAANSPATVVGNTTINVPGGDGIDAPPYHGPGGTLNINTEAAPNVTGRGPISITSGGTGVAAIFPSSPATINISSGPSGNVTIQSGGAALGVSGDVSLTATNANGGSLIFQSTGNYGVAAQFGASVNITGATIISNGPAGVLIGGNLTDVGAIGNLTNVNIIANNAIGLVATRMGTTATMSGGSITVTGSGLAGLYSDTNGVTNTTNVAISTTGANSYGALAEAVIPSTPLISPGGGTINITGGSITTQGMGAFGVFAQGQPSVPSTITLNNSTINTAGTGAAGYRADGGTISATNTTTQTSGTAAPGGILSNGGVLTINGGSVKTTGAGSVGFLVQPFTPALQSTAEPGLSLVPLAAQSVLPNTLQISNATVNSAADAFNVQGAVADIVVNRSSITSNNGVLLNTLSSGTTALTATGSQLTGLITTDSTSTANVTLRGNTNWTMSGSSNLTNLVNNSSNIIFTPPIGDPTQLSSYKTLTAMNYTGMGGGIALNTFLGADGSPSDQLVINKGTATGSTSLTIHNTTGPGLQTTSNGILVVNAINGATTAPGAFMLGNPELRAGEFDYRLFKGGLNGTDPNDWFLRSDFIGTPTQPSSPPPLVPIIGPELATDGVVQPIARQMGLQTLGTLHQRIGDTLTIANTGGDGAGVARSDWARFFGQGIDNHYQQSLADPRASGWMGGFQGGVDLVRTSFLPGHRDVAGVYLAFANSDINVNGLVTNAAATANVLTHTGTLGLNGYSAGGYWTHYGPSGWYLDAVLQGTYYQGNAVTQFANLPINGSGFISSLEGGYPIPLPLGPRFVLEPQAQIIWQRVAFNQANDGLGPVGLGTTSGETGRVGLRGMWTIDGQNGQVWQPYGRVNLWRDWGAGATTMFGIDPVPLFEESTRLEFAGGVTALLGRGVSLYAQAGYQFALDNTFIRNGIQGNIGLRYVW